MGTTLEIHISVDFIDEGLIRNSERSNQRLADGSAHNLADVSFDNSAVDSAVNSVTARGTLAEQIQLLISAAFEHAQSLAKALSFFDPNSHLSKFNQSHENFKLECSGTRSIELQHTVGSTPQTTAESVFSDCSEQVLFEQTLQTAKHLAARFPIGFLLNCNGKSAVDLSGIAKGAVVDEVYNWIGARLQDLLTQKLGHVNGHSRSPIHENGHSHGAGDGRHATTGSQWSVNAGGDLRVSGASTVEVRVPALNREEKEYNLQMLGSAVATSSLQGLDLTIGTSAAKYSHDFQLSSRAATVTVIASTCKMADAFTKIAFQYDLLQELPIGEANEYGLLAVLSFDHDGELIGAQEWNE